ncbi:MAG: cysteine desulfurase, partial [Elusimicrobia bacterium]|nr:cysteine desulfurase [Elusimicrobiota bacterium]
MSSHPFNRVLAKPLFDVRKIREDFPILKTKIHGHPLVYLDNAATTQKPQVVIQAIQDYYAQINSNIHRGVHTLSEQATQRYEEARKTVQEFVHASNPREIIFVRGATEAVNLVAQSFGRQKVHEGDEIIISTLEHHSNIVPWQILCEETGAKLRVIPIGDNGELLLDQYENLIHSQTRLVAVTHVSNALGTVNPVQKIIEIAHDRNVPVLVDGAQAAPHIEVDVQALDCDFYLFSGHKLYAPTGIGVLYGKESLLEKMSPYQSGGDMIRSVTFEKTTYNALPYKFEAGTPNVAGTIGLGVAIRYLNTIGLKNIAQHEKELIETLADTLSKIPKLKIVGTPQERAGAVSFVLEGAHPHDVGTVLDREG